MDSVVSAGAGKGAEE